MNANENALEDYLQILDESNTAYVILNSEFVPLNFKEMYHRMVKPSQKQIYLEILDRTVKSINFFNKLRLGVVMLITFWLDLESPNNHFVVDCLMEFKFQNHFIDFMHVACESSTKTLSPEVRIFKGFLEEVMLTYHKLMRKKFKSDLITDAIDTFIGHQHWEEMCESEVQRAAAKLDAINLENVGKRQKCKLNHLYEFAANLPKTFTMKSDSRISIDSDATSVDDGNVSSDCLSDVASVATEEEIVADFIESPEMVAHSNDVDNVENSSGSDYDEYTLENNAHSNGDDIPDQTAAIDADCNVTTKISADYVGSGIGAAQTKQLDDNQESDSVAEMWLQFSDK